MLRFAGEYLYVCRAFAMIFHIGGGLYMYPWASDASAVVWEEEVRTFDAGVTAQEKGATEKE